MMKFNFPNMETVNFCLNYSPIVTTSHIPERFKKNSNLVSPYYSQNSDHIARRYNRDMEHRL